MKARALLCLAAVALLVASGCASTAADGTKRKPMGVASKSAQVYVDGELKGTTPATFRVKRGMGASEIALRSGTRELRLFELERAYTTNRSMLDYSFNTSQHDMVRTYDVVNLSRLKNGTYLIPYYDEPIVIEDREYGLTLMVEN